MSLTYTYPVRTTTAPVGGATAAKQDQQTALLQEIVNGLHIVDQLDTPLLDTSVTNIPGSAAAALIVVSSLAAAVKSVNLQDTTGFAIGIYSDPTGTNRLECIINPGSDSILPVASTPIPLGTVIGLRSMITAPITVGTLTIQFLG